MSDFTYNLPTDQQFQKGLEKLLEVSSFPEILKLVKSSKTELRSSGRFSNRRWNAHSLDIAFQTDFETFTESTQIELHPLKELCEKIIPANAGYDLKKVEFVPIIGDDDSFDAEKEIKEINSTLEDSESDFEIPVDLLQKGREMTSAYYFLYYVENTLRIFIKKVSETEFGSDSIASLKWTEPLKRGIASRKESEKKHRWMKLRGDDDLFYLDFTDLMALMNANWPLFKKFFPSLEWIKVKIDELAECRHLVAHNSYIDEHERNVILTNFKSIIKQIGKQEL